MDEFLKQKGIPQDEKKKIIEQYFAGADYQTLEQEKERYITEIVSGIGNPERVTTCALKASLDYQGIKFEIDENGFSSSQVKIRAGLGFFSGLKTAYSFGERSMIFGKNG